MRAIIPALGSALMFASAAAAQTPPPPISVAMPVWVSVPTADEILAAYPKDALQKKLAGSAVIKCVVNADGTMRKCGTINESPYGAGFDKAAVSLAPRFRVAPKFDDGSPVEGGTVTIPVKFTPPD